MTPTAPRPDIPPEDEISLLDILTIIWGGKFWVAGIVAIALAVGAISAGYYFGFLLGAAGPYRAASASTHGSSGRLGHHQNRDRIDLGRGTPALSAIHAIVDRRG